MGGTLLDMENSTMDSTTRYGITQASLEVFLAYAKDAPNWSGTPLVGGNVGGGPEERGNLTQLKRKKLIRTWVDEGETWIEFTELGRQLATEHGIHLY